MDNLRVETAAVPKIIQWVNVVADRLRLRPALCSAGLKARAIAETGLSDFGDPVFETGLNELLASYFAEDNASLFSRAALRSYLQKLLAERLRVVAELRANPGIEDVDLSKGILICGFPRTGTTLLHHMLAIDEDVRSPVQWEMEYPCPAPSPQVARDDPRRLRIIKRNRALNKAAPGFQWMHKLDADLPEECTILMARTFQSPLFLASHRVPSYAERLFHQDLSGAFAFYRQQLQLLAFHFPGQRMVLKNVQLLGFIEQLSACLPELFLVVPHRDPTAFVTSYAGMIHLTRSIGNEHTDPRDAGAESLDFLGRSADKLLAFERLHPGRCLHVSYKRLCEQPLLQLRRIYQACGLRWRDAYALKVTNWRRENPKNKSGVHRYTPEAFGLTRQQIEQRFADYIAYFGEYL